MPDAASAFFAASPGGADAWQRNVQLVNVLYAFYDAMWSRMSTWRADVSDVAADALDAVNALIAAIVEPMLAAAAEHLEEGIAAIHVVDAATSFVPALQKRASSVQSSLVSALHCGSDGADWAAALSAAYEKSLVSHVVLVRVADAAARKQLAGMLTAALAVPLAGKREGAGAALLAVLESATAEDAVAAGGALPRHIVAHHLIGRADAALAMPHKRLGMGEAAYVAWMQQRAPAEVEQVVVKCAKEYAAEVNRRGGKEYTTEYPVILRLLEQ